MDLTHFSAQQQAVIQAGEGPLCVLAAPGSGKTTTLAGRIAYLVLERHVPATSILAITFTTAAAAAMRQRLAGVLGPLAHQVDIATFHALGLRLIRQWSHQLGYGSVPAVYGRDDARAVLREAAEGLGLAVAADERRRPADPWAAPPAEDRDLTMWRQWLAITDPGPAGLLELADRVAAGPTLPGLDACSEQDRVSWTYFVERLTDTARQWDWRARDNRREAALGLATRCDAAELYESLRLGDPLIATREAFGGTVVSGLITNVPAQGLLEVRLDRLACRLREDTAVEGYPGRPDQVPTSGGHPLLRGRVAATRVSAEERLVLSLRDVLVRSGPTRRGQPVTLRPRAVDPRQQRNNRQELHRRYAARRSWLSGGAPPAPRRRDVPLDVVIAAAEPVGA